MISIKKREKCCGCFACANICPVDAISMQNDKKGFWYPKIDARKCIKCNKCDSVCPFNNAIDVKRKPVSFACANNDEAVLENSSSGGAFSLLADKIIETNGSVYGAAFSDDWEVRHIRIVEKADIQKLRASKYVQSYIGNTFRMVKQDLDCGMNVLFTGTPCQIYGLYGYLGNKKYDNLLTQDIICHGVPSPRVWKKYLSDISEENHSKPQMITFRDKTYYKNGIYSMKIIFDNKEYVAGNLSDPYMKAFLNDVDLRDSCYSCPYKTVNRISDFTLADFWGIRNVVPNFPNKEKGVSLVIANSEKALHFLESVMESATLIETDFNESIQHNPMMTASANVALGRNKFFKKLNSMSIEELNIKYIDNRNKLFFERAKRKFKSKLQ